MSQFEFNLILTISRPIDRLLYRFNAPALFFLPIRRSNRRLAWLTSQGATETWAERFNRRWEARKHQIIKDHYSAQGIDIDNPADLQSMWERDEKRWAAMGYARRRPSLTDFHHD